MLHSHLCFCKSPKSNEKFPELSQRRKTLCLHALKPRTEMQSLSVMCSLHFCEVLCGFGQFINHCMFHLTHAHVCYKLPAKAFEQFSFRMFYSISVYAPGDPFLCHKKGSATLLQHPLHKSLMLSLSRKPRKFCVITAVDTSSGKVKRQPMTALSKSSWGHRLVSPTYQGASESHPKLQLHQSSLSMPLGDSALLMLFLSLSLSLLWLS